MSRSVLLKRVICGYCTQRRLERQSGTTHVLHSTEHASGAATHIREDGPAFSACTCCDVIRREGGAPDLVITQGWGSQGRGLLEVPEEEEGVGESQKNGGEGTVGRQRKSGRGDGGAL